MRRSHFIEKYKITDKLPASPDNSVIAVYDFVNETNKFLSENFAGLLRIETDLSSYEHIRLSIDHIIYFFKLVITNIHAKSLVNVNFSCNNSGFSIKISADGGLPIEDFEMRDLIRAARNAGFSARRADDGLLLTKAVLTAKALSVFAKIIVKSGVLTKRFAEMFFGE